MTGPCLCGDPACGRCFVQVRVHCIGCSWRGWQYETLDLPEPIDLPIAGDVCPNCQMLQVIEDEEGYGHGV